MRRLGKSVAQAVAIQAAVSRDLDKNGFSIVWIFFGDSCTLILHTLVNGLAYAEETSHL